MKKAICKIAAFITTIIFYWGLLIERNLDRYRRDDSWYWPNLKYVEEPGAVLFFGLLCQAFFVFLIGAFIQNVMVLVGFLAIVGTIGLLVALFLGTFQCVMKNSDKDD